MAKDTEKLIRQLSLISYLMAERRPVTALEIRRDVEGYSGMNEDAFARRFYADRAELESLRIQLTVERPADGAAEQENYSLRPGELPPSGDRVHRPGAGRVADRAAAARRRVRLRRAAAPGAAADHLGPAEPAAAPEQRVGRARHHRLGWRTRALGRAWRRSRRRSSATRRSPSTTTRWSVTRSGARRVDPYHLLFQGGQFYLLGYAHEREAIRVFRLSRIRGKVSYATKAEHDFRGPTDFDPRSYASRADWQLGERSGIAEMPDRRADRLADRAPLRALRRDRRAGGRLGAGDRHRSATEYASPRQIVSWVLGLGENARLLGPPELIEELRGDWSCCGSAMARIRRTCTSRCAGRARPAVARSCGEAAAAAPSPADRAAATASGGERGEAAIRPERFARLVTLASILIHAAAPASVCRWRRSASACRSPTRSCVRTSTS